MLRIKTIIGFLLLTALPALAAETVYSSVIDDLPLMQGMAEKPDDTVIFDKPGGRIVAFSAETSATAEAVRGFYQQTLPPLGWKSSQASKFIRDDETLKIDFEKSGAETLVHFTLTPNTQGK
jgi:hypothetical protein